MERFPEVMIAVFRICIINAIATLSLRLSETERNDISQYEYKDMLLNEAIWNVRMMFDPDNHDLFIPLSIQVALEEMIKERVKQTYVFE